MATSTQLRSWWAAYRCKPDKMVKVAFPGNGRVWNLLVAAEAAPLWRRFTELMVQHNYLFLESTGGTYKCRKISGSSKYSIHSYGTALDLNPRKNPYKRPLTHNYPQAFIDAVLAETINGKQAFRWGGSWSKPDAMHWEINVAPSDIEQGEDMSDFIKAEQENLNAAGFTDMNGNVLTEDGKLGAKTQSAMLNRDKAAKSQQQGMTQSAGDSRYVILGQAHTLRKTTTPN